MKTWEKNRDFSRFECCFKGRLGKLLNLKLQIGVAKVLKVSDRRGKELKA